MFVYKIKLFVAISGLNFINILSTAFTLPDPKCAKKTVKLAVSFGAFGTYERKSCTLNIGEIDTWIATAYNEQDVTICKHL